MNTYILLPITPPDETFPSIVCWNGPPRVDATLNDEGEPVVTDRNGKETHAAEVLRRAVPYVSAALRALEMAGQRVTVEALALPAPDVIYGAGGPWMLADSAEWSTEGVAVRVWHDGVRVGLSLGMMRTVPAARAHVLASLAAVLYAEQLDATENQETP